MTQATFLRRALVADAVTSGATGLLLMAAAAPLERLLGVPAELSRYAGLSLLPFVALVAWLVARDRFPPTAVWAVIALNALWAADSIVLLLSGWIEPTALGIAFVIAQAVVVAAFAELEYVGLRRIRAPA